MIEKGGADYDCQAHTQIPTLDPPNEKAKTYKNLNPTGLKSL